MAADDEERRGTDRRKDDRDYAGPERRVGDRRDLDPETPDPAEKVADQLGDFA